MTIDDFRTNIICNKCHIPLVRVPQSVVPIPEAEPDAAIICPKCGAFGVYKEVMEQDAGLRSDVLTQERLADIVEKLRVSPNLP
jgi:RNase P subunit RPR2